MILGSQFKEITVRQKFFKELPKDKSVKIYHFDIKTELEYVTDFIGRDYNFIQLEESKDGVKQFFQFLHNNKDKIENIQIEGAEIINSTFVNKIREGEKFTPADFYTAKQNDSCQWYGVMHDYDVVRNDYEKIKNIALRCFDKPYFKKVAAVVHGFGGCGKSTLLRRLAVELKDSPFKIVWLKDREFDNLADIGLKQIKEDTSRNYLLIIEDWYRIISKDKTQEFLAKSEAISNLRIIIGDREVADKDYIAHLYQFENQFQLLPDENEKIINDILNKFKDWKPAAEKVLKNNAEKSSSLFLLLFVIARINEEQFGETEISFSDPTTAFRDIVKSDLKKINAKYPGLAKALHNWACIYSNYKIFIDFNSFLKVADAYNGNTKISEDFNNWNANFPVMYRLKNYINVYKDSSLKNKKLHSIDLVRFNHDKLAEDGLAYVVLFGWNLFYNPITKKYENDKLLKEFLKIVLEYGGNYFSSAFLAIILQYFKQSFNSNEKIEFINKLFNKGNLQQHYLNHLADDDIGLLPPEIKSYLYDLFDKQVYPYNAWLGYFRKANPIAKHQAAIKILAALDITLLIYHIVIAAFNQKGYDEKSKQEIGKAKHEAAIKILKSFSLLKDNDINSFNEHILIAAFNQNSYDEKSNQEIGKARNEVAIKILKSFSLLSDNGINTFKESILRAAFYQKGHDEKSKQEIEKAKYEAAIKIFKSFSLLSDSEINSFNEHILRAAFDQKGYDEKSKQEIEKAKYEAAIKIFKLFSLLSDSEINSFNEHILRAAFYQKGYDEKSKQEIEKAKYEAAIKIFKLFSLLSDSEINSFKESILMAIFDQKGYDEKSKQEIEKAKHQVAIKILGDYDWDIKKDNLMFQTLRFFSSEAFYPSKVNELITGIINQFHQHKYEKDSRLYYRRLNIIIGYPFHNIPLWRSNCLYYISNWRNEKMINFFVKVLYSFRSHPDEIKFVCKQILKNWKREVSIEIRQINGEKHYGDHIKLALGHPDLREIAMIAAEEMAAEEEQNPNTLPGYLLDIVLKILQEKPEFPEWNKNAENESDTQLSE